VRPATADARPAKPVTAPARQTHPAYSEDEFIPAVPGRSDLKSEKPKKNKNPYSVDPWERLEALADTVTPGKPKVDSTARYSVDQFGKKKPVTPASPGTASGAGSRPGSTAGTAAKPPVKKDTVVKAPEQVFETPNLEPAPIPPSQLMKAQKDTARKALKEVTEQGTASWIDDEKVNPNKFYALHRSAPIGTIIKVTNTLNKQSVFVKVVGALPESAESANLLIKISKAAAKKLGVAEAKFQAELSYGVPQ
jgi:rare lipoprotein A (peptidoglycan hydrolase)